MTELARTIRDAVAAIAAGDPELRRFGAAHHRYQLAPADPATLDRLRAALGEPAAAAGARASDPAAPAIDELFEIAAIAGGGGAGPGYGWIAIERALDAVIAAPPGVTAWQRALAVAHLGCSQVAVLALDGAARGEVWLDARAAGVVRPIFPGLTAWYADWIERLARGKWPAAYLPPDACALPAALTGYLAAYERAHELAEGTLAGPALAEALAQLGPGAIAIAGAPPLFAPDDRVDPCVGCARLLENLGLSPRVVAPGAVRPVV